MSTMADDRGASDARADSLLDRTVLESPPDGGAGLIYPRTGWGVALLAFPDDPREALTLITRPARAH